MTDKSLDYRMQRFFTWMFGIGFFIAFVMTNLAYNQRDEALRFRSQFGDVQLVCKAVQQ